MSSSQLLRNNIYLIGDVDVKIVGNQLPTKLQVLKLLFYYTRHKNLSLEDSGRRVVREVLPFWEKAGVPTQAEHRCVQKLEKLYQEWRNLQRHRARPSNANKEKTFALDLEKMFDVAHALADKQMDDEKKEFLFDQRSKRNKYIANIQTVHDAQSIARRIEEMEQSMERKRKAEMLQQRLDEIKEFKSRSCELSELTSGQKSVGSNFTSTLEPDAGPSATKKTCRGVRV